MGLLQRAAGVAFALLALIPVCNGQTVKSCAQPCIQPDYVSKATGCKLDPNNVTTKTLDCICHNEQINNTLFCCAYYACGLNYAYYGFREKFINADLCANYGPVFITQPAALCKEQGNLLPSGVSSSPPSSSSSSTKTESGASAPTSAGSSPSSSSSSSGLSPGAGAGIGIGGAAVLVGLIAIVWFVLRKRKQKRTQVAQPAPATMIQGPGYNGGNAYGTAHAAEKDGMGYVEAPLQPWRQELDSAQRSELPVGRG